ncbi:MAG: VanZ family protein, partial [Oscillospiraceae bacterium]
ILVCLITIPIATIIIVYRGKVKKRNGLHYNYLVESIFALLIIYFLVLIALTLTPMPITNNGQIKINLIPFLNIIEIFNEKVINPNYSILLIILNILLFIPLGSLFTLFLNLKRKYVFIRVFLIGFFVSFFIEFFQLVFITGRTTDIDDIINNVIGTLLGCIIMKLGIYFFQIKCKNIE